MVVLDEFDFSLEAAPQAVHIIDVRVKVEFAPWRGTRPAAGAQHDFTLSQAQQRPIDLALIALVVDITDFESDRCVPPAP